MKQTLEQLLASVQELTASVKELSDRSDTQQQVIDRLEAQRKGLHSTRIVLGFAIMGILLDLALTVGGVFVYIQLREVQDKTSSQILCPLYQVFAQSLKSNPAPPGLTPEQIELRKNAAVAITNGLSKLGC